MRPAALAAILALCAGSGGLLASPAYAATTDVSTVVADVAVVLPLTVPITDPAVEYSDPKLVPTSTPTLIDAETLSYYTSPTGILTTELTSVYDSDVTIGIDPLILASIRALGSKAPASARAWLDQLGLATNPTFALPWADSDMTAPLQAGRRRVVKPTSLDFAIDPTRFSAATAATPSPDPTATLDPDAGGAPPLPTSAELTAWQYTLPSIAWPQADTVATKDFATIAGGYDATLLTSTNVARSNVTSATASIGGHDVLVSDKALSALVSTALSAPDTDSWNSAMDSVTASIAALSGRTTKADPGSIVVTLDRDTAVPTSRLSDTVAAIDALPTARLVGLGAVTGATPSTATLISEKQASARLASIKTLLAEESTDARFATVADDPSLITGERRIRLLNALSPSVALQTGGFSAAAAGYLTESQTLLKSVSLAPSSGILLLGDTESIRRAVVNELNQAVTVYIEVRSLSPNLTVKQSRVELKIEPDYQRTASVPVQAISNGEVQLAVRLTTKTHVTLGETAFVPATVRAGWEGPFTLIAGILVVLIFAAGIVRTVLRRRAARSLAETS